MKNQDKRAITSRENGKAGGRPVAMDFSSVAKILLKGLQRLAATEGLHIEVTASLAGKRLNNNSRKLCAGFDEVISSARDEYLKRLDKLGAPDPIQVRNKLRKDLDAITIEVKAALKILRAKAEVALEQAEELGVTLDADIEPQLKKIASLEIKTLDQIVDLIIGIIEERLDRFGIPILS